MPRFMGYIQPPGPDVRQNNPMMPNPELARQFQQPWATDPVAAARMPVEPRPLAPTAKRQTMHQDQVDDMVAVVLPKQKRQRQRRSPIPRRKITPEVIPRPQPQPQPPSPPPPIPMPVPMPSFTQPPAGVQLGKSLWKLDEVSPKPRDLRRNIELEVQLCARVGTFDMCCLNGYPVMRDLGPR